MRRAGCTSRLLATAAVACALALLAASVHVTPARTLRVVTGDDAPLPGSWVAYHFRGHRFATVQSNVFERPGEILRAGDDGAVRLAARLHFRLWPFDRGPERVLDLVYAPALHNATRLEGATAGHGGALGIDGDRLVVADLTEEAGGRRETVEALHGFLRYDLLGNHGDRWPAAGTDTVDALIEALARETAAYVAGWPEPLPTSAVRWVRLVELRELAARREVATR